MTEWPSPTHLCLECRALFAGNVHGPCDPSKRVALASLVDDASMRYAAGEPIVLVEGWDPSDPTFGHHVTGWTMLGCAAYLLVQAPLFAPLFVAASVLVFYRTRRYRRSPHRAVDAREGIVVAGESGKLPWSEGRVIGFALEARDKRAIIWSWARCRSCSVALNDGTVVQVPAGELVLSGPGTPGEMTSATVADAVGPRVAALAGTDRVSVYATILFGGERVSLSLREHGAPIMRILRGRKRLPAARLVDD